MAPIASSTVQEPDLLALDFDGVVCDGLREYFHSAWLAHGVFWPQDDRPDLPALEAQFCRLRPVIETGWEMPVLIQALLLGVEEAVIQADWPQQAHHLIAQYDLDPKNIGQTLDGLRDRQITENLDQWLSLHRFYPGVIDRLQSLQASGFPWVIITTKEGRFAHRLLQQAGVEIDRDRIFGKEVKQPKAQTLDRLAQTLPPQSHIWFIEDRLPTLHKVRQYQAQHSQDPAAAAEGSGVQGIAAVTIELFLADWGYNTTRDRQQAATDPSLRCLTLHQFSQPFSTWLTQ